MDVVRTPDERFENLTGYDFSPNYAEVRSLESVPTTLRVHYLDEGPADGPVVLLMHGEPSWSYLYRTMIPVLVDAGLRCIAVDLVGFGRSDKPTERDDYTYNRHVQWIREALFDALDLTDITLMCQDWGGLIGLRLVAEHPERFARVVAANTFLPTGEIPAGKAFSAWQEMSQTIEDFDSGAIVDFGTTSELTPEVVAGYNAPFPTEEYKAGARVFPLLVPTSVDQPGAPENRVAWESLRNFTKPFLCAFSDNDPITGGADKFLIDAIPGAKGQEHTTIEGGGHFLQEDCGEALAHVIAGFVKSTT